VSYVKLFESILESTVWQESLHVKVVWITMLAMKDRDGVVEASIPGLGRRAGVTTEQCEEAINKFLAPDKYSRTKEHDGRRIEAVDGGWYVLNHDKYREKLDEDDQRAKATERMRRLRERRKGGDAGDVTRDAGDVTVRHADTEADPDPSGGEPAREIPPSTEHGTGTGTAPRTETGARTEPPGDLEHQLRATLAQNTADEPARRARKALGDAVWKRLNELRQEIGRELGLEGVRPVHFQDPGRTALGMRLRESESLDVAKENAEHVLAVLAAEARNQRTVQWITGAAFDERSWRRALGMTLADTARQRSGPRSSAISAPDEPRRLKRL
jgi:hypothetical protein